MISPGCDCGDPGAPRWGSGLRQQGAGRRDVAGDELDDLARVGVHLEKLADSRRVVLAGEGAGLDRRPFERDDAGSGATEQRGQIVWHEGVERWIATEGIGLREHPCDVLGVAERVFLAVDGAFERCREEGDAVFEPVPLAALLVGDTIDVGGFLDAEGRIRATRISRKIDDLEIELRGYVSGHHGAARSFQISGSTIEYGAALLENVPPGGLVDGLFVEIDAAEPPSGDVMVATDLTVLDPALPFDEGDGLGIEGFVTSVESPTEVVVGGNQRIRLTPATRFEGGGVADLKLDAQIDADGYADADGTLIATEIEFQG